MGMYRDNSPVLVEDVKQQLAGESDKGYIRYFIDKLYDKGVLIFTEKKELYQHYGINLG